MNIERSFLPLLLAVLLIGAGCGSNSDGCDPDRDCFFVEPDSGYVLIEVTIDNSFPTVPIAIYDGTLEEGTLVYRDTVNDSPWRVWLPVERRYTVSAEYIIGQDTILAVDADRIRTKYDSNCEYDCWELDNAKVDLELQR